MQGYLRETEPSGEEDGEDEDVDLASPVKRRRSMLSEAAKQRRSELWAYYSERSGYGKPSALLLFELGHVLGVESAMSLW